MTTSELQQLSDLVVNVRSTTPISFDIKPIAQSAANYKLDEDALRAKKQRAEFCKPKHWWNCTEQATQGTCAFVNGQCQGAPLPVEVRAESYYSQWLRLYTPIYAKIPKPNIDADGELITPLQIRHPRRRSTHRARRQSHSKERY